MPGMSGLELQDHLSRLGSEIPIIFITAYPDETIKARALSAGALCFLHKPIDPGVKQTTLPGLLGGAERVCRTGATPRRLSLHGTRQRQGN